MGITTQQATDILTNNSKVSNVTHTGEVTGNNTLTISDNVVDIDNLHPSLKYISSLVGSTINFSTNNQYNVLLSSNTSFSITSPVPAKVLTLVVTGNYDVTFPSSVKGDYSAYDKTKTNVFYLHCIDATSPIYIVSLYKF